MKNDAALADLARREQDAANHISALNKLLIGLASAPEVQRLGRTMSDIRNDLVNNLTHELKTPISTISLACEALADPSMPKTEQQVRTYTTMIRDENKRL